jgi:hypothetical protein
MMRPFERRAAAAWPYYKLASWDAELCAWKAGKRAHPTEGAARAEARAPGRYRVTRFTEGGREELDPFEVEAPAA